MTIYTTPKPISRKNEQTLSIHEGRPVTTTDRPPFYNTLTQQIQKAINLHRDHRAIYIPHITYADKDSLMT